jgi:hypothetical protein
MWCKAKRRSNVSNDKINQFAERVTADTDIVDSIMAYPHPFTNGGVVVVFNKAAGSYSQLHSTVVRAVPPTGEMHIVKRSDLFLLSIPRFSPLAPLDYPHMVFFLKSRGRLVYGEDLREDIPNPSCIDSMLIHLLDTTACWFRAHNILHGLATYAYASLIEAIDARLRFLMAITLLCRSGKWDVQASSVPADFFSEFADERLNEVWAEICEFRTSSQHKDIEFASAIKATWLFEVFTRELRRYAP